MKKSAGLLVYRRNNDSQLEVLIAHPGGPFYARKDEGVWSVPKGLFSDSEEPLAAARREYEEEIGQPAPSGEAIDLGEIKRSDGKLITVWAVEGEADTTKVISNTFELEWPPKSGRKQNFPEIDRAMWADLETAGRKLHPSQVPFLNRLANKLGESPPSGPPSQASLF